MDSEDVVSVRFLFLIFFSAIIIATTFQTPKNFFYFVFMVAVNYAYLYNSFYGICHEYVYTFCMKYLCLKRMNGSSL
jgi:hypothetical protein